MTSALTMEANQDLADQGDANAQYNLGNSYHDGEGVKKNLKEAVRLWRLAADQGHADAQFALGNFFNSGTGVEKNATL